MMNNPTWQLTDCQKACTSCQSVYKHWKSNGFHQLDPQSILVFKYHHRNHRKSQNLLYTALYIYTKRKMIVHVHVQETWSDKKHSENADISMSVTFDLEVWPLPFVKVKKADVIHKCCLLYCTLVPGIMSKGLIFYEI